jgi:hypothetical protein
VTRRGDHEAVMEFLSAEQSVLPECSCRGPVEFCRSCRWEQAIVAYRRLLAVEAPELRPQPQQVWAWMRVGWGDEGDGEASSDATGPGRSQGQHKGERAAAEVPRRTDYRPVMDFIRGEEAYMSRCTCKGPLDLCRRCHWLAATEALRRLVAGEAEALRPDFWRAWEPVPWGNGEDIGD